MPSDFTVLVAERLERVRRALGVRAHRDAAEKALVAIGRAAQAEAERRAARKAPTRVPGNVIRFPLGRAGKRGHIGSEEG
ncbi:hypothetical protein [Salinarimonas soli]|uniref:Uncharacterized protein n=1 Tax=Salinarimonas soli TaxID=1638099 RepID=A0A5B2V8X9_9HYPH|nr:hypothetical protein [Salinarimonas soli]KAA2234910.1 hypothetical protein F0L46_21425 [Salinarimonas soli]